MTKSGAKEAAAEVNSTIFAGTTLEARVVAPERKNVRGTGYGVAIFDGPVVVAPTQYEKRDLVKRAKAARTGVR